MILLFNRMYFVCVSCKPVSRYALILRMEMSFGCAEETMVNIKVKLTSKILDGSHLWYTIGFAFPSLCNVEIWSLWGATLHGGTHFHA